MALNEESNSKLVSVIIAFWNTEKYIQEAIESVFDQTYTNWELMLVDDGSTDRSTEIAKKIAEKHPHKVHYLEHEDHQNLGISSSRNLGILHAKGKYIAFLDSDDVWFPNILSEQVDILEGCDQAAMVFGRLSYWFSWTGKPEDRQLDYIEELGVAPDELVKPPKMLALFLVDKATVPSGILVRRDAIVRYGMFEEAFRGEYEDQVLLAKICLHAPVFASSRCWYRYRRHPESTVSIGEMTGQTNAARLFFLQWLARYLSEKRVRDPKVWWSLHKEMWRFTHPRLFWFSRRLRIFLSRISLHRLNTSVTRKT
jgi:glycosyltransferase involved in cell wall biosynthesis